MRRSTELLGSACVITGGAGLLGREHAIAMLSLGADVVLWDLNLTQLAEREQDLLSEFPGSRIIAQNVDITSESSVIEKFNELLAQGLNPRVLINNAAINYSPESLKDSETRPENFSVENWRNEIEVGLTGAFICSKIIGSYFIGAKQGVIINISSDLSVIAPDQRIYEKSNLSIEEQPMKPVSYSVTKTGLIGLTRYLASSWANFGIRVNAISPGGVFNNHQSEFTQKIEERIPLGRMAKKEDYRSAIQFLSTDDSEYMTGQNLIMDGGRSIW